MEYLVIAQVLTDPMYTFIFFEFQLAADKLAHGYGGGKVTCHIAIVVTKLGATELLSPILSPILNFAGFKNRNWSHCYPSAHKPDPCMWWTITAKSRFPQWESKMLLLNLGTFFPKTLCFIFSLNLPFNYFTSSVRVCIYLFFNVVIVCIVVGRVICGSSSWC